MQNMEDFLSQHGIAKLFCMARYIIIFTLKFLIHHYQNIALSHTYKMRGSTSNDVLFLPPITVHI